MPLIDYERDEYGLVHIEVEADDPMTAARIWYMVYQETVGIDDQDQDDGGEGEVTEP